MKKMMISLGFAALALGATAQVKIKDGSVTGTSAVPNQNSILDLESSTRGLHLPRVSLTATTSPSPLNETSFSTSDTGLYVYNTATANDVSPGVYYCDGTKWIRVVNNVPAPTLFQYGTGAVTAASPTPSNTTNSIYVDTGSTSATLGQSWIYDGTAWQTYTPPAATEWNYAGSANADAGSNKTASVSRSGSVVIGANATPATVATTSSGSTAAQRLATLTVSGGDAYINGLTVGKGAAQLYGNTAVGNGSLQAVTSGNFNTAVGQIALQANTSGIQNVAVGLQALLKNTEGSYNTGVGEDALIFNTNGSNNTACGWQTLYNNTTGSNNTALGYNAGGSQTAGSNNIVIGYLQSLANLTGSNQLNIGGAIWGTGLNSNGGIGSGSIGINITNPSYTLQVNGSVAGTGNYNALSDARYKQDVQPLTNSLDKVLQLRGITFNWNRPYAKEHGMNVDSLNHIGFLAQEVEKIFPQVVTTGKDENHTKAVAYSDLVPVLAEAIKEQQKEIEKQHEENKRQQAEIDALKKQVEQLLKK